MFKLHSLYCPTYYCYDIVMYMAECIVLAMLNINCYFYIKECFLYDLFWRPLHFDYFPLHDYFQY